MNVPSPGRQPQPVSRRRRPGRRSGQVALVLTATGLAAAGQNQWALTGGGIWNSTNNWMDGVIPNAAGASVLIGPGLASDSTITLGSLTRVGDLTLNSEWSISVVGTGANRLTFAESPLTSEALLAALGGGNHSVSHLGLGSNLHVVVDEDSTLSWSGSLTGTDRTIRKTGTGLLTIAPGTDVNSLIRTLWTIESGTVAFPGILGGTGTNNSSSLRLDGGQVRFTGLGSTVLQGGWSIGPRGGFVDVGAGRTIQVNGPVTDVGTFTKVGPGKLGFTSTGGSTFSGDVRFLEGTIFSTAAQPYVIRGGYVDRTNATLEINGAASTTTLVRALTFENGRTNVLTAGIRLADNAKGGVGASGPDTLVEVQSLIQSSDGRNQNLYLSTRNGGVLVIGANARIDTTLPDGVNTRPTEYWDDGSGQIRLAPGFVANYAPSDPTTGWAGFDVYGGTLVSSESQNLPEFMRFNTPRVAAENVWRTEHAAQVYGASVRLNASTRITTITDLELTGTSMAAGVNLIKDGPGTLVLDPDPAHNSFGLGTGILVEEGTVQIGYQVASADNLAVDVRSGARLTGDGRMGALLVSGTIAPGRPGQDFASLTAGLVAMDGQATFAVDLGTDPATDVDRLVVNGLIGLDGQLSLTLLAEPTPFVQYVIVDNRFNLPVLGTFDQGTSVSADFGGITYPFEINYSGGDGNDVILLTVVPEPGAASLALLGAGVWLLGRRAARRR